VLALVFAVSFFLKFAFENNWVGPGARVAIGLLFGAGLLAYSRRLLEREYRYFSEGIAGLGVAVLDLSVYAGHAYYHLFGRPFAFAGMSCVTAVTVALAGARNSQRIALRALVGGLLTPLLLTTGIDQQAALFSYLILLDAALLALAGFRNWRGLELVSLAFTLGFFWAWYADFYPPSKLAATAAFAGAFFVLFAALPVIRSRREEQLRGVQIALVLVNAFAFLGALDCLLWPDDRWALGAGAAGAVGPAPGRVAGDPQRPRRLLHPPGLCGTGADVCHAGDSRALGRAMDHHRLGDRGGGVGLRGGAGAEGGPARRRRVLPSFYVVGSGRREVNHGHRSRDSLDPGAPGKPVALPGLAPGGRPADAHEQPRPRGRREAR